MYIIPIYCSNSSPSVWIFTATQSFIQYGDLDAWETKHVYTYARIKLEANCSNIYKRHVNKMTQELQTCIEICKEYDLGNFC